MIKMPTDKEWYMRAAEAEGDYAIGAGSGRMTMTMHPSAAEIAEMERIQLESLPKWAQDEIERLRASLYRIIELEHHIMSEESRATKIAREALNHDR